MPCFSYTAFDSQGEEKSGQVDAVNAEAAATGLKAKGLFPTEIVGLGVSVGPSLTPKVSPGESSSPKTAGPAPKTTLPAKRGFNRELRIPFLPPVAAKELAGFTRQLGTLLKAGMPLLRGLEILSRQERNRTFKGIMEALADDIRSGSSLSDAMARHPRVFDRLYANMIKAGEAGGVLDVVLERLAKFQEKSLQLKGKIKAAMMYPIIVMGVAVMILAGLLVFVVPKFQQIFADLLKGAPLPPLTQAVLVASDAVRQHYLIVLAALIGGWIGFRFFRRSPSGSRAVDGCLIRIPLFGELIMKSLVARFTRTLGTLLSSGVPILQAITITRDTSSNVCVADALEVVHDRVKAGDPIARPLESTQVFPAMVTSMIDVGEHTGQLPEMLNKVADIYDEEVDTAVAGLSSLIEPILIVLLAGVVGTIVIALFLPIVRIVQLLT